MKSLSIQILNNLDMNVENHIIDHFNAYVMTNLWNKITSIRFGVDIFIKIREGGQYE